MSDAGWIKAHRQMLEHPLLQRGDALGLWTRLLLLAAHRPTQTHFRSQSVTLARGQCAVVLSDLAERMGITRQRMRTIVNAWRDDGMLKVNQAQGKAFSVVTICNFDTYQALALPAAEPEQPRKNQAATKQQPTEQGEEEGKKRSDPADRAAKPPKDAKSHLWREMKAAIKGCDDSIEDPGALVGKWIVHAGGGKKGEGAVFAAHLEAIEHEPAHYLTWMHRQFNGKATKRGPPSSADLEAEALRILNESESSTDEPEPADPGGPDATARRYEASGHLH